jgi:outer membrane protein OmpA-like peptidoglycan-associated protein
MSDRAMSLPLLALALAMFCDPSVSFAQSDRAATGPTRPATQAQPTAGTLVAQAQTQPFVVYFALGKATLDEQARATVASAAQEFQRSGSARISVRGHTDTSGNASFNQALSERREQAISDELVRLGVPPGAITGEALGEADLAVPTGDGVREAQNRRVEIAVEAPPPPPPPAPAPEPTPPVAEAPPPSPLMEELKRGVFSVGPFYGFNTEDESGNTSHLAGLNLSFDYAALPWLGVGLEQAGFYHFSTKDDGLGGRSAASLNLLLGGITGTDFGPYVGGNIGYLYGEGFDDDFFAGPELGFTVGHFAGKVAYDIPFNRDLDEGIINTTLGFAFQF